MGKEHPALGQVDGKLWLSKRRRLDVEERCNGQVYIVQRRLLFCRRAFDDSKALSRHRL